MLSKRDLEIERLMAIEAMMFYSEYRLNKLIKEYWSGIVTGLELALGILPSIHEEYYGMKYEEYYERISRFFIYWFGGAYFSFIEDMKKIGKEVDI